jgi:hypothetical protein
MPVSLCSIQLDGREIEYSRPPLKLWLMLEDAKETINKAVKGTSRDAIASSICSYLSIALSVSIEELQSLPWYEVAAAYVEVQTANYPQYEFPFLNANVDDRRETWDYEGRTWFIWAHIFAKAFGWKLEYIAELDVDDAIALAQEIAVDNQLEKEFEWMISEVPHQIEGGFKPLQRPRWMLFSPKPPEIKKVKIRKEFMPVGYIIHADGTTSGEGS